MFFQFLQSKKKPDGARSKLVDELQSLVHVQGLLILKKYRYDTIKNVIEWQ